MSSGLKARTGPASMNARDRATTRPAVFIDEVLIDAIAGNGGDGNAAMRRERGNPFAGPAGGDGGRGGDVVLVGDAGLSTLLDLQFEPRLSAKKGEHGRGRDQYGRHGDDCERRVPVGTRVIDADSGRVIADISAHQERVVVAKGGRGGLGNLHFVTPYDQAPTKCEPGEAGERLRLRLELRLFADVGLLGYPNVGKSTFISVVSRARPKIADYPFTTLVPNLGVVSLGEERNFVVADIPGIIEGAAEGAGLGLRFLRHVERTRVLLHLITVDPSPERDPVRDFGVLMNELQRFDPELAKRAMIVAFSKIDVPEVLAEAKRVQAALKELGHRVFLISAATREGVDELLLECERLVNETRPPKP